MNPDLSKIDATISFLDDDNLGTVKAALANLQRYAVEDPDLVSGRLAQGSAGQQAVGEILLEDLRTGAVRDRLVRLSQQLVDLPGLEQAALLLVEFRHGPAAIAPVPDMLDRMARELEQRLVGAADTWAIFRQFLFDEQGFHGNRTDYYSPDNSYLNQVLQSRTGIPITLSLLVLCLAHRLNLPIVGVSMPGHFVLRYGQLLLDPFHGGRLLTEADCAEMCDDMGLPFQRAYLNEAPPLQILLRMVNNLIGSYERQGIQHWVRRLALLHNAL